MNVFIKERFHGGLDILVRNVCSSLGIGGTDGIQRRPWPTAVFPSLRFVS
jgi:hypothetical protein